MEYIQPMDILYFIAIPFILWFGLGIIATVLGFLVIIFTSRLAGYCEARADRVIHGDDYAERKHEQLEQEFERTSDEWPISRWISGCITSVIHWPAWTWAVAEIASENTDIIVHSIKRLKKYAN